MHDPFEDLEGFGIDSANSNDADEESFTGLTGVVSEQRDDDY